MLQNTSIPMTHALGHIHNIRVIIVASRTLYLWFGFLDATNYSVVRLSSPSFIPLLPALCLVKDLRRFCARCNAPESLIVWCASLGHLWCLVSLTCLVIMLVRSRFTIGRVLLRPLLPTSWSDHLRAPNGRAWMPAPAFYPRHASHRQQTGASQQARTCSKIWTFLTFRRTILPVVQKMFGGCCRQELLPPMLGKTGCEAPRLQQQHTAKTTTQ